MEVSGVAFQISSSAAAAASSGAAQFSGGSLRFSSIKSKKSIPSLRLSGVSSSATNCNSTSGFSDNAHVDYYNAATATATAQKKKEKELNSTKKTMKKKLKLIKGLSKDLSAFSDMGFGLDPDADPQLAYQFKGKMISEAAELLLGQLEQLKAEEKELKKKRKEEKAKLRAAKKRMGKEDSSSSSSSDSECEGEVVDLNRLKTETETPQPQPQPQSFIDQESMAPPTKMMDIRVLGNNILNSNLAPEKKMKKKIEVCMGGKCKKSGAPLLMEEFHKAVGMEGEVVGCKCMGKCRDGPNVRVESNPLCIGVGLEDVGFIVSKFVGGGANHLSELGLAAS